MKQLKISLIIVVATLLFTSCQKNCIEKPPKDLKPINWDGYNDVYTVFWNTVHLCSETINLQSDTIKISGWYAPYDLFALCDDPKDADRSSSGDSRDRTHPVIFIKDGLSNFQEIIDTCDLRKKIFLKGKLVLGARNVGFCCEKEPEIQDVYDIYFE